MEGGSQSDLLQRPSLPWPDKGPQHVAAKDSVPAQATLALRWQAVSPPPRQVLLVRLARLRQALEARLRQAAREELLPDPARVAGVENRRGSPWPGRGSEPARLRGNSPMWGLMYSFWGRFRGTGPESRVRYVDGSKDSAPSHEDPKASSAREAGRHHPERLVGERRQIPSDTRRRFAKRCKLCRQGSSPL